MISLLALVAGVGTTLLLSNVRLLCCKSRHAQLRPYIAGTAILQRRAWSGGSFRDVLLPLMQSSGAWLAQLLGIEEDLASRLRFVRSTKSPTDFRLRQFAFAIGSIFLASVVGTVLPAAFALALMLVAPLLTFCVVEQNLSQQATKRRRKLFLELPIVCEQLAMLLSAGWSLGSALNRLAQRGNGTIAQDLDSVCRRIRQGMSEDRALQEWSQLANVPSLSRLVSVLLLNNETSELGDFVSDEAQAIRRDAHRELIVTLERRAQMVWVPVTVATLIPGVIFLAIPFYSALQPFNS